MGDAGTCRSSSESKTIHYKTYITTKQIIWKYYSSKVNELKVFRK